MEESIPLLPSIGAFVAGVPKMRGKSQSAVPPGSSNCVRSGEPARAITKEGPAIAWRIQFMYNKKYSRAPGLEGAEGSEGSTGNEG